MTMAPGPHRKPRVLWAQVQCLLDTSSGACITVREMLLQLVGAGHEVHILGATVFDHERGAATLQGRWPAGRARPGTVVHLPDGALTHALYVTARTAREAMTVAEEGVWFYLYRQALDRVRPDMVFYFGGQPLDLLMAAEARARGIPVVFYLANGTYQHARWCRDVDVILTNSEANAGLYARRLGVQPVAVGPFVDPARVLAPAHERRRILFVNPSPEKGALVVIRLAMLLEKRRPDIVFEVVESRGDWAAMLRQMSAAMGQRREHLANVVVTPHTGDMRPVYGRARLLLMPSLWWESMGRVLVEALLNGIPAVVTDRGGMPDLAGEAGVILRLDAACYEVPYTHCPTDEALAPLVQRLETLFDDEAAYARLVEAAWARGRAHDRARSTQRLLQALAPWLARCAGDADAGAAVRAQHRHGLDDRLPPGRGTTMQA